MQIVSAPDFSKGLGLLVQIRTKIRYAYSFIEAAAILIGEDIFEVASYGDYVWNGISNADLATATVGGFNIVHTQEGEHSHLFEIRKPNEKQGVLVKVWKDMVSIKFIHPSIQEFGTSAGVLGSFLTGEKLARDGVTVVEDANEFGQEWQVRDGEPQLFMTPSTVTGKCLLPSDNVIAERKRRLGESVSEEAAHLACQQIKEKAALEACVYDVLATGDLGAAEAGAF